MVWYVYVPVGACLMVVVVMVCVFVCVYVFDGVFVCGVVFGDRTSVLVYAWQTPLNQDVGSQTQDKD